MVTKLTLLLSLKGHLIFDATLSRERILVHSLNSSFNLHFGIWRFLANKIANRPCSVMQISNYIDRDLLAFCI